MRAPGRRVFAALAVVLALSSGGCGDEAPSPGSVSFGGRSPLAPETETVRVLFRLARPSLGERAARGALEPARQRAYVRSLRREAEALRSALAAKAVTLSDVVGYERVWNGFAATIQTADLPRVQTLGVRVEPVRRFYPATLSVAQARAPEEGVPAGQSQPAGADGAGRASGMVVLLDSGVDLRHPALRGRTTALADVVEGDGDPSPGALAGRRDEHGTQVAGVLADELGDAGRIGIVRVAGLVRDPVSGAVSEVATTDTVLAGLERAVDPDRNGDARDAAAIALVGVASPYSGFSSAPAALAAESAQALGTLVVAPVGNEGRRVGRFGTVASPAASPSVLAVGALEGTGAALPRVRVGLASEDGRAALDAVLLGGPGGALEAPAVGLSGPSQRDPSGRGRSTGSNPLDYYGVDAAPRARGRVVVVPATSEAGDRPPPGEVAEAARAAGAVAVVVCEPDDDRSLRALSRASAAGIPVVGLSGAAARRALELTRGPATAFLSDPEPRAAEGPVRVAAASSEGPTYGFVGKPDVLAPGTARAPVAGGGEAFAAGTSIAAARIAAGALALRGARPGWSAAEVAGALAATRDGDGVPDPARAAAAPVLVSASSLAFPRRDPGRRFSATRTLRLRNPGEGSARLSVRITLHDPPEGLRIESPRAVVPRPGREARLALRAVATRPLGAGLVRGRIELRRGKRSVSVPLLLTVQPPPPAVLGPLELVRDQGEVRGVRFSAGSVRRDGESLSVLPLGRLALTLTTARGRVVRELTPAGGARDILPAEYAYTLTGETLRELDRGAYRFVARAEAPARGARAERESAEFEVR